jgi:hypothetical protein
MPAASNIGAGDDLHQGGIVAKTPAAVSFAKIGVEIHPSHDNSFPADAK